jgi:hypothetical protein
MEHEHRDTRLNYDYSVATYFQRKHAYTETPLCAIHLTVLHYYIFFYASTCSLGELDEIMNKTKFQRLKI